MSQVIQQSNSSLSVPPTVHNIPPNYPSRPSPNKISLLFDSNFHDIYHKFSPFTQGDEYFGIFPNKQPFIWRYIDEAQNSTFNKLPTAVKTLVTATSVPAVIDDVVRVSKFLISPLGIIYNVKQFGLQLLQPFDETKIYNPLSPILATVVPATLGFGDRPKRHIEGGLLGLLNSVTSTIGINFQSGYSTPASTVGSSALPTENQGQGKGLIRGADSGKAYAQLQSKWPITSPAPGTGLKSLGTMMSNAVKSLISNFLPTAPVAAQFRADETTYPLMINSYKLYYYDLTGKQIPMSQMWFAGSPTNQQKASFISSVTSIAKNLSNLNLSGVNNALSGMSPLSNTSANWAPKRYKMYSLPLGFSFRRADTGIQGNSIKNKPTGYTITPLDSKYGNIIKVSPDNSYQNSDMLVQFGYYIDINNDYPTKMSDPTSPANESISKTQKDVLRKIESSNAYSTLVNTYSKIISSGKGNTDRFSTGYNELFKQLPSDPNPAAASYGITSEYYNAFNSAKPIDSKYNRSLRMATSFRSDGLNQIGILSYDKSIQNAYGIKLNYPKWTEWEPYSDDLIAFFFYDVVNSKYIPFRATVKGLSEANTAYWGELKFIGRADQLYSYNGFARTLSFSFNIVINSIYELLPTWKKINYMASCVKPSNYTYTAPNDFNTPFNRFMIPPMFMITIGDLYKFQPVVITTVNTNIPDDAIWETLSEESDIKEWGYLNGMIKAPHLGKSYAQLPREVEIMISCNVLEKERAILGGSNFGHAPRTDNWESPREDIFVVAKSGSKQPYLSEPTYFSLDMVEFNRIDDKIGKSKTTNNSIDKQNQKTNQQQSGNPNFNFTSLPTTSGQQ